LLGKLKGREGPQSFGEVQKIRESLNKVGGTDEDKAAADYAKRLIDDYLTRIPEQHVISGDPVADAAILRQAGKNYRGAMRTRALEPEGAEIGSAMERAERQAGKGGTGFNLGNTLRQRIDAILNSKTERNYFTDDELQALRKIVVGSAGQNVLRYLGKTLTPSGSFSAAPYLGFFAGGTYFGHGVETAAAEAIPAAIGYASHLAENAVTRNAIRKVAERIRAETPLGKSMAATQSYRPLTAGGLLRYAPFDALVQSPPDDALQ
jgi:hypothetical protein